MAFEKIKQKIKKKKMQRKFRTMTIMIYNTLKKYDQPERAIINYILQQAKTNEIQLARKDGKAYISFVNEEISTFLNDWVMISNNKEKDGLSDGAYNDFFKTMLNKYKMDVTFNFEKGKITAVPENKTDSKSEE